MEHVRWVAVIVHRLLLHHHHQLSRAFPNVFRQGEEAREKEKERKEEWKRRGDERDIGGLRELKEKKSKRLND